MATARKSQLPAPRRTDVLVPEFVAVPAHDRAAEGSEQLAESLGLLAVPDQLRDNVAAAKERVRELRHNAGGTLTEAGVSAAVLDEAVAAAGRAALVASKAAERIVAHVRAELPSGRSGDPSAAVTLSSYLDSHANGTEGREAVVRDIAALQQVALNGTPDEAKAIAADIRDRGDLVGLFVVDACRSSTIRARIVQRLGLTDETLPQWRLATRVSYASRRGDGTVQLALQLGGRLLVNAAAAAAALVSLAGGFAAPRIEAPIADALAPLRALTAQLDQPTRPVRTMDRAGNVHTS